MIWEFEKRKVSTFDEKLSICWKMRSINRLRCIHASQFKILKFHMPLHFIYPKFQQFSIVKILPEMLNFFYLSFKVHLYTMVITAEKNEIHIGQV